MITEAEECRKNGLWKRARMTRKKLKKPALDVFCEKNIDAVTVEKIENQIFEYLSLEIGLLKIRRLVCAVAGFVFGFFSFIMLGTTENEIKEGIKPLRRIFVNGSCTFLE